MGWLDPHDRRYRSYVVGYTQTCTYRHTTPVCCAKWECQTKQPIISATALVCDEDVMTWVCGLGSGAGGCRELACSWRRFMLVERMRRWYGLQFEDVWSGVGEPWRGSCVGNRRLRSDSDGRRTRMNAPRKDVCQRYTYHINTATTITVTTTPCTIVADARHHPHNNSKGLQAIFFLQPLCII